MAEMRPTICRVCAAHCGILVEVSDGQVVAAAGDRDNPLYGGYICPKGRTLPEQHRHAGRLLHSMKRGADGTHAPVAHEQALDEIATTLAGLLERHGPRSIALYAGTYAFMYPLATPMAMAWMNAIDSPMRFVPATIDKPGKGIAMALHGRWAAGPQTFAGADTWMIVGANPPVSRSIGAPPNNGAGQLHAAVRRGLQLIVVDPRRTESARLATVHLQCRPGEDPAIIAGMLRVILQEERLDRRFAAENAQGLEELARAVDPFTPELVAQRADVPADLLVRAARIFAAGPRGFAVAGTGPNMAPRGTLSEYLLLCLNTICGRWLRAGERVPNPGVLTPAFLPRAQPVAPGPGWGFGERLRVRGFTNTAAGLPTAALPEEILLEGAGQVRALICVGGNPVAAWPDQQKTLAAMQRLELLVTVDPEMSATSKLAHYVIAPRLSLEQPGLTLPIETLSTYAYGMGYESPYAQYAPQLIDPPASADVIEDWELFHGLARRMGLALSLAPAYPWISSGSAAEPVQLDMQRQPTTDELLEVLTRGSRVPLAQVKTHAHGHVFGEEAVTVQPKDPACGARLDLANAAMLTELREVASETEAITADHAYRLVPRRLPDVYNSFGRSFPLLVRKSRHNPAFMHPDDLAALTVAPGELIEIRSDYGTILGIAEADPGLRRGLVSMTHAFGDLPGGDEAALARTAGSNIGRLIPVDRDFDPHSGIPRMSAVPVSVHRHAARLDS
ncbi:MAG: molybdopterin-dependent oxidoreductase [Gammaproteobacteria bacterium]|nr:molybdopterin-dependent oxidoreductase [Gammaproteobacteria bacterium]